MLQEKDRLSKVDIVETPFGRLFIEYEELHIQQPISAVDLMQRPEAYGKEHICPYFFFGTLHCHKVNCDGCDYYNRRGK